MTLLGRAAMAACNACKLMRSNLAKEFGVDRRRNKPLRPITITEKTVTALRAADSTEVGNPCDQSEIPEQSIDVPRKYWPRGLPPQGSQRNPDIRNAVSHYVENLIQLYESTDPARGSASEENKLEYARQAISMWWYLFGELLLWAQSHLAGYEIGRSNPDFMNKLGSRLIKSTMQARLPDK